MLSAFRQPLACVLWLAIGACCSCGGVSASDAGNTAGTGGNSINAPTVSGGSAATGGTSAAVPTSHTGGYQSGTSQGGTTQGTGGSSQTATASGGAGGTMQGSGGLMQSTGGATQGTGGTSQTTTTLGGAGQGGTTQGSGGTTQGGSSQGTSLCGTYGEGMGTVQTRTLSLVVGNGGWQLGQQTAGIAVDAANRVYIADYENVFVIDGSSVGRYLTLAEAQISASTSNQFQDLDIGPDGALYILTDTAVLRSSTAHQASLWQNVTASQLGVVSPDNVAVVVIYDGLWQLSDAANQRVYENASLVDNTSCACKDLAVSRSGEFLYQPGCNGSPLLRGNIDGSGIYALYQTDTFGTSPLHAHNFLCSARDPQGGFYVFAQGTSGSQLYHLCEDSTATSGVQEIPTAPTFQNAQSSDANFLAFWYCSMAVGQDGAVYLQTFSELWKISP